MTVIVTGASGHVGANLVRELLRRGRRVRAVLKEGREGAARPLEGLDVERVWADVRDPASLRAAFAGGEVVYHLAAMISISGDRGGLVMATNVEGAGNAAEAALACGLRRMIHFSSIHAFDPEPSTKPTDETRAKVRGPRHPAYDRSKAGGEARVRRAIDKGLDAVILNPTGILGPVDYGPSRSGRVLLTLYRREVSALSKGGFDWVDVRDVVASALAAEERGVTGENYLLGGHWHSLIDIARMAEEVTGVSAPRRVVPYWLIHAIAPFFTLAGRLSGNEPLVTREVVRALRSHQRVIHEKARIVLGHDPRPIRESIEDSYAWFAEAGVIPRVAGAALRGASSGP